MQREFLLRAASGAEYPLLPRPFCMVCSNPLSERWARINWRCWFCQDRLSNQFPRGVPRGRGRRSLKHFAFLSPFAFKQAAAAGLYVSDAPEKGEFGKRVVDFKYHGKGADEMAEVLDHVLKERYGRIAFEVVVPIPPEPGNRKSAPRELAKALIGLRGCSLVAALSLDNAYHSDKNVPAEAKFNATRGHFKVIGQPLFAGKRVLLVDDVMTTCGHAHWAAQSLMENGAAAVNVAVLARAFDMKGLRAIRYEGRF